MHDKVFQVLNNIGNEYRINGNEAKFIKCPFCYGGKRNEKQTCSVNLDTGAYICHRASCGAKGSLFDLAKNFNITIQNNNNYSKPPQKITPINIKKDDIVVNEVAISYFEKRGIKKEIVNKYKITSQKHNGEDVIIFTFFDDKNNARFIKYRQIINSQGKSKEWAKAGGQPILYGMENCLDDEYVIITEGQIDCLSLASVGIKNTLSVPNGAKGFTWIDPCYDFLKKFKEIIVFGDCQEGELTLIDEIYKRFPKSKVSYIKQDFYKDCKDANDILVKYGESYLSSCLENRIVKVSEFIQDIGDVDETLLDLYDSWDTGFWGLDKVIKGLHPEDLVILSGRRGEGKSTFLEQVCINLMLKGVKTFLYSGEMSKEILKRNLMLKIAGDKYSTKVKDRYDCIYYTVSTQYREEINNFLSKQLYLFDNKAVRKDDFGGLLQVVEEAILKKDIKVVFIDNLMISMYLEESKERDLYRKQGEFVQKLSNLAKSYGVAIILVAHPKKTDGELDNDSISGASDITNLADTVIYYQRAEEKDYIKYCESIGVDYDERNPEPFNSIITVTKNRLTGEWLNRDNAVKLVYKRNSRQLIEMGNKQIDYVEEFRKINFDKYLNSDIGFEKLEEVID